VSQGLWDKCLNHLENQLSTQQFNTWIRPLKVEQVGEELRILAPNRFVKDWVSRRFLGKIEEMCRLDKVVVCMDIAAVDPVSNVVTSAASKIIPQQSQSPRAAKTIIDRTLYSSSTKTRRRDDAPAVYHSSLNPAFSFETFVEGKSNQLGKAAALQVAQNPGGAYNPLFIYGGVGLGKTHLMHAVGNAIVAHNPKARAAYLHSEKFVQDMVKALQQNAINRFKNHYRTLNVLLIDDIQFFAGKERSQEEFFHTFNSLLEGQNQVILTCDRYPKEVDGLEERLKSRFGWGLTVAVEPPDFETRVAILMSKAQGLDANVPHEVAYFIAKRIRSNIRELEGALRRVVANARFTGNPITVDFTREALKDLIALQDKLVTIENIQKTVCEYYNIRINELLSKSRTRSVARPRQIAMALAKELTNHSLPEIGAAFGGRDHTTVIHACKKIQELKHQDNKVDEDVNKLLRVLTT